MDVYLAEFVGTGLLIIMGGGVCAGVTLSESKAKDSGWIVVTTGWGLGVALAIYSVGRISGAHINPAVTGWISFYRSLPLEPGSRLHYCSDAGRFFGSDNSVDRLFCPLGSNSGSNW